MKLGEMFRSPKGKIAALIPGFALALLPQAVAAQDEVAVESTEAVVEAAPAYTPMTPDPEVGQPEPGGWWFQDQHNQMGQDALWMNDVILTPIIVAISVLVLFLLIWVVARYNKRANPVPSKTSHNALLEVAWTVVPVIVLVAIAFPSVKLLLQQFEPAPEEAITIKATGYQWYWTYTYMDNGEFEVISYMLNQPGEQVVNPGVREVGSEAWDGPAQLEVDNRMVVPAGVPLRIQVIGADVIHSFAVPSLWFKLDAVPGQINEKMLIIDEPGVYYGQCSELCGAKHGYMPIAVEALPMAEFEAWVQLQGGTVGEPVAVEEDTESADDALEAGDVEGADAAVEAASEA